MFNIKKNTILSLFAASLMVTGFVSCDNESDAVYNENNGQLVNPALQKSGSFADIYNVAKGLGDTVVEDSTVDETNGIVFNSVQDYKDFVLEQKLALQAAMEDIIEIYGGCADGIYTGSIGAGMGTLYFDVVVSGGKITSVTGSLGGFTLGISYTQGAVSISGNSATVKGFVNYNVFFEGIGTVYSQPVTFLVSLNC